MHSRDARAAKRPDDPEARLAAYFAAYAETDLTSKQYLVRHPLATVTAMRDVAALQVETVEIAPTFEGDLIREALPSTARGPRSLAAALSLPSTPEAYSKGSSKQTVRRKVRVAEKAGVTWSTVTDPDEKRVLFDQANEYERVHPRQQYRKPPLVRSPLQHVDLFQVARGADGRPLMLTITPVEGKAALLGMFRTLEPTDEASAARYLMTKVLAEQLIRQGVTHLFDGVHPANLTNGLRHFQRMVGFRLTRIAQRTGAVAPAAAPVPTPR